MNETEQFIAKYNAWSYQEKFNDFKFIKRLTPQEEDNLLSGSILNVYAFLFGPLYYTYLGLVRSVFYIILSFLFFSFGFDIGFLLYISFSLILSLRANTHYIGFLKRKMEKYKNFNPDADTPYFNISNQKLIILSLLTGNIYLMYWMYRNAKGIKIFQKDSIKPIWQAIFMSFTSINVFRAISHSVKSLGYQKDLKPITSAWLVFLLTAAYSFEYEGNEGDILSLNLLTTLIFIYWIMILLTILLFSKYQNAIRFYSEKKNIPITPITGWECFWVFVGCLLNAGAIYTTTILISIHLKL